MSRELLSRSGELSHFRSMASYVTAFGTSIFARKNRARQSTCIMARFKDPSWRPFWMTCHRFLIDGRRDLVILKFSHYDGFNRDVYNQMVKEIKASLDPWLLTTVPKDKRLADVPLAEMLAKHGVVLVVCDEDYPLADHSDGIWVYRDWSASDPEHGDLRVYDRYANVTDYEAMKADQFRKFREHNGKCKTRNYLPCDLFLLSWTLTPVTGVASYSKLPNEHLADDLKGMKVPNSHGCVCNLLYADYVETADLTNVAMAQNALIEQLETH